MINKLRFRFIRITMVAVLIVLAVILSTINLVNFSRNSQALDEITQRLAENNTHLKSKQEGEDDRQVNFSGIGRGKPFPFQNEKELPFSTRFFTIRVDQSGAIVGHNLRQIASVTEADMEGIKDGILGRSASVGWYRSFRYRVTETDSGYLLIGLEATSTLNSIRYVLFLSLAVGAVSVVLLLSIVAVFSKRAIRPIAEAYDKQKQFITDAGHELKTPLTVISANAEIMALTYGKNEWCDGIARQTQTMRDLIGQMIQMAKLDENDAETRLERFDLSDAVYDTVMSFETLALRRGLRLEADIAPGIGVVGSEAAVRQVAAILMDNAVKYCDAEGCITVSLSAAGKRGRAALAVSNTFSAVDALDIGSLFDRFYRGDKARDGDNNSFGLGLSIAKSIMERHGGELVCRKSGEREIQFVATFRI